MFLTISNLLSMLKRSNLCVCRWGDEEEGELDSGGMPRYAILTNPTCVGNAKMIFMCVGVLYCRYN